MSIEKRFNAAVSVIRGLPKNGKIQVGKIIRLLLFKYCELNIQVKRVSMFGERQTSVQKEIFNERKQIFLRSYLIQTQ